MKKRTLAVMIASFGISAAQASQIERACNQSGLDAANRALCGCIQDVANLTLSGSDQKLASTFYADPQKAQDIRQSDRIGHEQFWDRYKEFGETAKAFCG